MDKMFERLNRIYPNSKYVLIAPYNADLWKDVEYDSSLDNKAPLNRWKSNPYSYEQISKYIEDGYRVGWVVPKGYVVVDIDNKDNKLSQQYLEKLLKKFEVKYSYNYTFHGMHILLRDQSEQIKSDAIVKCALNIAIDTRANETGYIILPVNDPHREWGMWTDFVEEIPYFLKPALKTNAESFIGMVDGDGRNSALWSWRGKLEMTHKLSDEEIEKSIRIINENLFDTPIPNNELFKTVLRAKKNELEEKPQKKSRYNEYANILADKYDFISYGDVIYKFNGIYYKPLSLLEIEKIIHTELSQEINEAGRREIIKFLRIKTGVKQEELDKTWYKIACNNCVINLVTGEKEEPNKADMNTISIPLNYNPDVKFSPRIDKFIRDITEGDILKTEFLYQIAGYCLLKRNMFEKFFLFKGEGGTGKSTYLNLISRMVGPENCAYVGLADFDKDYYISTCVTKLVNIDDDVVDSRMLENTGRFKSIVSGNKITVRQIYQEPCDYIPYCTCIFSCNKLPKIADKTTGLYRRIVLLELNAHISKPDPQFMNKITDEDMEYFLYKAVEGIKIAIEEGRFKIQHSDEALLNLLKRRQSAVNEWLYENNVTTGDIINKSCTSLYSMYTNWATENGYATKVTMFTFKEEVCSLYRVGVKLVVPEGKSMPIRVFFAEGEYNANYRPF